MSGKWVYMYTEYWIKDSYINAPTKTLSWFKSPEKIQRYYNRKLGLKHYDCMWN